jgi:hypothetical protein
VASHDSLVPAIALKQPEPVAVFPDTFYGGQPPEPLPRQVTKRHLLPFLTNSRLHDSAQGLDRRVQLLRCDN